VAATRSSEPAARVEGIVAKRLDSVYQPGRRSPDWIKVKIFRTQEVVVGGWKPGQAAAAGHSARYSWGSPT
jgi:bifunctional non-homologous end joining protein LigD